MYNEAGHRTGSVPVCPTSFCAVNRFDDSFLSPTVKVALLQTSVYPSIMPPCQLFGEYLRGSCMSRLSWDFSAFPYGERVR